MWLYVPPTSCLSAPASGALISVSDSPAQNPAVSVSLSGKAVLRPLSWRGWKTRPWIRHLFGTISAPSTAARGVESWISSLRGFHANPTPSPASKQATPTSVPSGQSSSASWEKCDPPWSSLKTSQLSLLPDTSGQLEKNYAGWVTRSRNRSSYVRQMLARHIGGSGCSYSPNWPTARAMDNSQGGPQSWTETGRGSTLTTATQNWPTPDAQLMNDGADPVKHAARIARLKEKHNNGNGAGTTLAMASQQWPTPRGTDGPKGGPNQKGSSGDLMLPSAASQWHTPTVPNGGRVNPQGTTPTGKAPDGSKKQIGLENQTSQWPTPRASPNENRTTQRAPSHHAGTHGKNLAAEAAKWGTPGANDGNDSKPRLEHKSRLKHQVGSFQPSPQAQETSTPGEPSLPSTPNSPQHSPSQSSTRSASTTRSPVDRLLTRRLNPLFVEWLIGVPPGLSDCVCLETARYRSWWQSHSALLSMLLD